MITLKRSGRLPLQFEGELLAKVDGFTRPNEPSRWHEIAVYRADGGSLVIGIKLGSRWQGEHDHYLAEHATDPAEIESIIRAYDPCPPGIGYPPGPSYEERQARVLTDLRRRYDALVTELFEELGSEFVERVK